MKRSSIFVAQAGGWAARVVGMQWLMTSYVGRYHRHYRSSGHVWQGRFKAFSIEQDEHLLTVMRYVERHPVRAKSVEVCSEVKIERIHGRNALIDQAQRNDLFPVRR